MRTNLVTTILAATLLGGCVAGDASLGSTQEDSAIASDPAHRWPNPIPYVIDHDGTYINKAIAHCKGADGDGPSWQPLAAGDDDMIHAGLAEYAEVTPLRFQEFQPGQEPSGPYIIYTASTQTNGSFTSIPNGMPTDGLPGCILLSGGGEISVHTILHETGHALGMPHEQQRFDAWTTPGGIIFDSKCVSNTDDMLPVPSPTSFEALAPYDYDSVMQYQGTSHCDQTISGCQLPGGGCAHPPMVKELPGCTKGTTAAICQIGKNTDLSPTDVNVLTLAYEKRLGSNEAGDGFGGALAVGDFDGDGFQDLAVGAPGETVPGHAQGAVFLYKGTSSPQAGTLGRLAAWKVLAPMGNGLFTHFGEALAVGDFDGDGVDDLAVAAPGAPGGGDEPLGGAVFVYSVVPYVHIDGTTANPIDLTQTQELTELNLGMSLQAGDRFGAALAAGDFDGDGVDDLAIGIPQRAVGGAVQIAVGAKHHELSAGAKLTAAGVSGGQNVAGARFGAALVAKNLDPDADHRADLVVGAPGENATVSGDAYVFHGTAAGLVGAAHLDGSVAGGGGRFGVALAAGDFDGRTVGGARIPYLAIGATGVDSGTGHIYVYQRAASGLTFSRVEGLFEPTGAAQPGDHVGAVLDAHTLDGSGNPVLVAGVPDHGPGGVVLIYRHAAGDSLPLGFAFTSVGSATQAGDRYGSAIAGGDFIGAAGAQDEIVVGSEGAIGGAGQVRLGDLGNASFSWQPEIDQESASPE